MKRTLQTALLALLLAPTLTGCGSLSLFSSKHDHLHQYQAKETEEKLVDLKRRVDILEQMHAHGHAVGKEADMEDEEREVTPLKED